MRRIQNAIVRRIKGVRVGDLRQSSQQSDRGPEVRDRFPDGGRPLGRAGDDPESPLNRYPLPCSGIVEPVAKGAVRAGDRPWGRRERITLPAGHAIDQRGRGNDNELKLRHTQKLTANKRAAASASFN